PQHLARLRLHLPERTRHHDSTTALASLRSGVTEPPRNGATHDEGEKPSHSTSGKQGIPRWRLERIDFGGRGRSGSSAAPSRSPDIRHSSWRSASMDPRLRQVQRQSFSTACRFAARLPDPGCLSAQNALATRLSDPTRTDFGTHSPALGQRTDNTTTQDGMTFAQKTSTPPISGRSSLSKGAGALHCSDLGWGGPLVLLPAVEDYRPAIRRHNVGQSSSSHLYAPSGLSPTCTECRACATLVVAS